MNKNLVKDLEFSGSTYQVLVTDAKTHKEEWVFLQLDEQGRCRDTFCSCQEGTNDATCPHQTLAMAYIYGKHRLPLHRRFERSLWNQLFCHFGTLSRKEGTPPSPSRQKVFKFKSSETGEEISIRPTEEKTAEMVAGAILNRRYETEENSLKFSNLSEEELAHWNRGTPTPQLAFELSSWSDLAKVMMLLQEKKEPSIEFIGPQKSCQKGLKPVLPDLNSNVL
jgi:hypothetical protein